MADAIAFTQIQVKQALLWRELLPLKPQLPCPATYDRFVPQDVV